MCSKSVDDVHSVDITAARRRGKPHGCYTMRLLKGLMFNNTYVDEYFNPVFVKCRKGQLGGTCPTKDIEPGDMTVDDWHSGMSVSVPIVVMRPQLTPVSVRK